jgi:hypothetical protein
MLILLVIASLTIVATLLPDQTNPVGRLFVPAWLVLALTIHVLDFYDAIVRRRRDRSTSSVAVIVATLGLPTLGLASIAYYLRWGWQPLPPECDPRQAPLGLHSAEHVPAPKS